MVFQKFLLWTEKFSGEKFSQKTKTSHGKRKFLTVKEKFSQQKKFSQGTKNSHNERKILTAKEKFSQQKKNSQNKTKVHMAKGRFS